MLLNWIKARFQPADAQDAPVKRAEELRGQGDLEAARQACLAALRESPENVPALTLMAVIAADQGQLEAGRQWARQAIAVDPQSVRAHYVLGRLWEDAQRYTEAEDCYRRVTLLDPDHARAHNNLGCMLHMQGRLSEALACYRKALQIDPDQPEAMRNYASIAGGSEGLLAAMDGFLQNIAKNPGDASSHHNLANIYVQLGRRHEALAHYERAIAIEPEHAEFHFAKAHLLLLLGEYAQGWKEYDWRWRMNAFNAPAFRFPQPMWDGRKMDGGTLLVHGETGFGDMLQFVRYVALAAQRCASVVVECQPALKTLLRNVDGVTQVVAQGEALPSFDAHMPLIGFPGVFGTTLTTIPWQGPYIQADPELVKEWAPLVAASCPQGLKVGLVWTGNPQNLGNQRRSLDLQMLSPLAEVSNVTFVSLQKGVSASEMGQPPAGLKFIDLTSRITNFSATAALLAHLDLVISVDTSVAHLAGAMGVPTWVALPFAADWRYHAERDDNPWYPTMRLFRQEREGEWDSVVQRLAMALARRAQEGS